MIDLERLVKEFKARGGKIKRVPRGVSGEVVGKSFFARSFAKTILAKKRRQDLVDGGFRGGSVSTGRLSTGEGGSMHHVIPVDVAIARGELA